MLHSGGDAEAEYFKRVDNQRKAAPPPEIPGQSWRCATAWEFGGKSHLEYSWSWVGMREGQERRLGWSAVVGSPSILGDCILQTRGEAAVGIERREWQVTIGGRERQLWTWTTWMGGACRASLGECAGFCDHWNTMG